MLFRFGLHREMFRLPELTLVSYRRIRPELSHDLKTFKKPSDNPLRRYSRSLIMHSGSTHPYSKDEASVTQLVERRKCLGELHWLASRRYENIGAKGDSARKTSSIGEEGDGLHPWKVPGRQVLDPDPIKTECLRPSHESPDQRYIDGSLDK